MRYVALLRGIAPMNPNMRNEKLRGVLSGLGFRDVRSVISSGNVIFTADSADPCELENAIEAAWPAQLGFTSTTILRTAEQLDRLIEAQPFAGWEDSHSSYLNVTFLKHPPAVGLAVPHSGDGGYIVTTAAERAICSVIDGSAARPPDIMRWLERTYGKQITTRTWKTVHRIKTAMG